MQIGVKKDIKEDDLIDLGEGMAIDTPDEKKDDKKDVEMVIDPKEPKIVAKPEKTAEVDKNDPQANLKMSRWVSISVTCH